ncbi:hypothetical protein PEX1_096990 [Penicillium expansum]|uniref:Uncharacterized protein n=1 Tax=Penicillium expansum TaxID=27334 RepID=A0A0A2JZ80_PENEN|nr:hypothetical protein PEX2_100320 [Penicillium expansum]KGO36739.1 hypothetical protein PEXP_005380 [Penicillium expansum]KGO60767.1 hypothetical protein PEX2_100320 [Penicillium expansum]KGO67896.1 hypothetical protein PEX1_096990 [Penicillium expansum]
MRSSRLSKRRRVKGMETLKDLIPSLPAAPLTSPLFTVFPAEIRNRIYTLALESEDVLTDDSSRSLYKQNAFYYRPGYKQPKRIQTALLQTCQQIYAEASLLPPAVNEHTFWFYRSPPHVNDASSPLNYFRKMTPKQRAQVQHLHLFTQQFFLEDNQSHIWDGLKIGDDGHNLRGECRIAPKKMTITLRHTDWWHWENNEPLGIDPFRPGRTRAADMGQVVSPPAAARLWGNQFSSLPCLEELVIEFETIMRKRDQLDAIIQQAFEWKFPMQADKGLYLVADPKSKSAYTWSGAKEAELKRQRAAWPVDTEVRPESQSFQEQEPVPAAPALVPFDHQSSSGTNGEIKIGNNSQFDSNTEKFYVVFLTWRKQRVQG